MPASALISVQGLCREFHRPRRFDGPFGGLRTLLTRQHEVVRAVRDVSFTIEPGELVGYIGPNGAGKSTTIKMLTGILVPTSGSLEVGGVLPWRDRERNARQIGVVFGQRSQLWWDLPLIESFRLIGKLYDVPTDRLRDTVGHFTELLGMADFLQTPVRQLSLGQRMRGDLAAAMLYGPKILYLDEPTIGLDIVAKERIRDFIADLNADRRTTVILTTHDLGDLERLTSRIMLIDHGMLLYDGSLAALKHRYAPYRELVVQPADLESLQVAGTTRSKIEDGRVWLRVDPDSQQMAEVIGRLMARYGVADLAIVEPDLGGVIRQIYSDQHVDVTAPTAPAASGSSDDPGSWSGPGRSGDRDASGDPDSSGNPDSSGGPDSSGVRSKP
ncbi:ABC transporter ATP-binding protein [Microlunatus soli]|uniref:ABC-2 type transport system ATP-binding protein n=1 Tax=Microlunatus soli TaxID=630515 RepID=A0A1H1RKG3_9ACTN|nr:ATP-binding cassette domain-containing protein [Microlunatus soli]SDS36241.1 ABC-2 type transport system ATP-binding protein [Microlunatus soli]